MSVSGDQSRWGDSGVTAAGQLENSSWVGPSSTLKAYRPTVKMWAVTPVYMINHAEITKTKTCKYTHHTHHPSPRHGDRLFASPSRVSILKTFNHGCFFDVVTTGPDQMRWEGQRRHTAAFSPPLSFIHSHVYAPPPPLISLFG